MGGGAYTSTQSATPLRSLRPCPARSRRTHLLAQGIQGLEAAFLLSELLLQVGVLALIGMHCVKRVACRRSGAASRLPRTHPRSAPRASQGKRVGTVGTGGAAVQLRLLLAQEGLEIVRITVKVEHLHRLIDLLAASLER